MLDHDNILKYIVIAYAAGYNNDRFTINKNSLTYHLFMCMCVCMPCYEAFMRHDTLKWHNTR